jgi:tRNA-splicing ligase RtcB
MHDESSFKFVDEQQATAKLIAGRTPVTVVGTEKIRNGFEKGCLQQISNIANAPGIDRAVLNPDGHQGYGCPVGSVFSSRDYIYPNAVGPDVKCSMSFLQLNVGWDDIKDKTTRRALVNALEDRIPLGPGNHKGQKAQNFNPIEEIWDAAAFGATTEVLEKFGIPPEWSKRCEDASHGDPDTLLGRIKEIYNRFPAILKKLGQIGGVGGGNHFMEGNLVDVNPGMEDVANTFGLKQGKIGFLNHFGSRGFGFALTSGAKGWPGQFRLLEDKFKKWHTPFPGDDPHNVYVPLGEPEAEDYLNDMYLGANFATINHLLVCRYVLEAYREVLGDSVQADFVYYIAHNIIRNEVVDNAMSWVHRKGATRALPAGHHELKGTEFENTGHPILLPGNPIEGSTIMVGQPGSSLALNSVNHGAGRSMSRGQAKRTFDQKEVNESFDVADIITNCRNYPLDESAKSYKDYGEVIGSVELAGLAKTVARLKPVILLKDSDQRRETSA